MALGGDKTAQSERHDAGDGGVGLGGFLEVTAEGGGELRRVEEVLLVEYLPGEVLQLTG